MRTTGSSGSMRKNLENAIMSQPQRLRGSALAKVNLFLEVTGKRPDGFHAIDSVFAEVSLADQVTMSRRDDTRIVLETAGLDVPPEDNLVYKAVAALRDHCGGTGGVTMTLTKNIPAGGGLGGGSSDAALALRLANTCWETGLDTAALEKIGAGLGSDIPFFFHGGICVCQGRGEIITPVMPVANNSGTVQDNTLTALDLVVVLTGVHCNTGQAFRGLQLPVSGEEKHSSEFVNALVAGDLDSLSRCAFNRFESTIFKSYPRLGRLQKELSQQLARPVRLSGSGGSLWFFVRRSEKNALLANPDVVAWAAENTVQLLPCHIAPFRGES